jgi:hypothetical protein
VVSGAGGKLDGRQPTRFAEAGTVSWAAVPHCLLVQVRPDRLVIVPYGPDAGWGAADPGGPPAARRHADDEPIVVPPGLTGAGHGGRREASLAGGQCRRGVSLGLSAYLFGRSLSSEADRH